MSNAGSKKQAPEIGVLDELATYHLRRAQVSAFSNFTEAMAELGLTPGQFGVLTLIDSNDGLSQSAVARSLGVERSTMVAVIDGLENRGFVFRKPSLTDRRSNALVLSEEGEKVYARAVELVHESDARTTDGLTRAETEQMINLLRKMNKAAGV